MEKLAAGVHERDPLEMREEKRVDEGPGSARVEEER